MAGPCGITNPNGEADDVEGLVRSAAVAPLLADRMEPVGGENWNNCCNVSKKTEFIAIIKMVEMERPSPDFAGLLECSAFAILLCRFVQREGLA